MAASATATASGAPKLRYSCSDHRRSKPTKRLMGSTKFVIYTTNCSSSTRVGRSSLIRAFEPQKEEENLTIDNNDTAIISQEDLSYLWKLGAGSVVGAALIKYGSILFPEITSPNIVQALIMIATPVIVVVLLLIKQSRVE